MTDGCGICRGMIGKDRKHMNESYSVRDIINLLLSRIWLILTVTILGAAAGYGISRLVLPLKYSSHISMYVQSYTGISENANNVNNISNSKQLVNTYIEVMKDDAVMKAVGDQLAEQFDTDTLSRNFKLSAEGSVTPASLRSCLAISSVQDTSAVKVTATAKNAEVAAAICNDLTKVAPQYVEEAVGVGSINTIDTAKVYRTPVAPNVRKNTVLGGAAGFLCIVMLIFLIDFFDNTVKDSDALGQKYNKAILGEIQQFGTERKKRGQEADPHIRLTDAQVPFYIVESYKSIRTNVAFSLSTVENKIFAVSSPNPGDGKSTTAANIAIAMAQSGSRVLLIDADMRKAVIHKIFSLKNKKGLSSAVSRMCSPEECIQSAVMENLDVMPCGPIPPNPSELLASDSMGRMLEKLRGAYSVIIIDTPPVNIVTDAMELAKNVSGMIMVLRYGKTTDTDVETAVKKTEASGMNLFGFILNDVKVKRNGTYYSKYKGRYDYRSGYYGSRTESAENGEDDDPKDDRKENPKGRREAAGSSAGKSGKRSARRR